MTDSDGLRVTKWPFFLGDACLIALAITIFKLSEHPLGLGQIAACLAAVAAGALVGVWPFVLEHQIIAKLGEAKRLVSALSQLQQIEQLAAQITGATARWQTAQDAAEKTTDAAKAIAEKIDAEARAFQEFLQKTNDGEKKHLRLEVEKLQRAQGEWLQLAVHTLDHVFALHQAGIRSNQPNLAAQLTQFQQACRDLARRLGLVAFVPEPNEAFDPNAHQLTDSKAKAEAGEPLAEVVAPGYTFQGQLLRKAAVNTVSSSAASPKAEPKPDAQASLL